MSCGCSACPYQGRGTRARHFLPSLSRCGYRQVQKDDSMSQIGSCLGPGMCAKGSRLAVSAGNNQSRGTHSCYFSELTADSGAEIVEIWIGRESG